MLILPGALKQEVLYRLYIPSCQWCDITEKHQAKEDNYFFQMEAEFIPLHETSSQGVYGIGIVGIWVEQIVPHRLDVGMVLGI